MTELQQTIDSVSQRVDSIGEDYARELKRTAFSGVLRSTYFSEADSKKDAEKQ